MDGLTFGTLAVVERIVGVLAAVFGPEKSRALDSDFVRWISNGPHGQGRWYAAFDDTTPVAIFGLLPLLVMIDGKLVPGALCHNGGVIPAWRGRGVFTEIGRFARNDMRPYVALGVSNDAALRGHFKSGGNPQRTLEMMSIGDGIAWREPVAEEVDASSAAWLASHESLHNGHALKVHRSREFWDWRLQKPGETYFLTRDSDGYVVWKQRGPRKQVLAATDSDIIRLLGGRVDAFVIRGASKQKALWEAGFNPIFKRELIVWTDFNVNDGNIRFDACDFDLL